MSEDQNIYEVIRGTQEDVKQIKEALLGDAYGNPGYKSRIELLEKNSKFMKAKISAFDMGLKIVAGVIGLVGTIFAIIKYSQELKIILMMLQ